MKRVANLAYMLLGFAAAFAAPTGGVKNVKDFGAAGDRVTDDTAAIQSAITACGSGPCTVYLPSAVYKTSTTLTLAHDRITLMGDGPESTRILFTPAADDLAAISVGGGRGDIRYQDAVRSLSFDATESTYRKVGIRITHASETVVENVATYSWSGGSGAGSIGLQTRGREFLWAKNLSIVADSPVSIEDDPYDDNIDADHFHLEDCFLSDGGRNANPIITVASGIYLTDVSFDGTQSWDGGTYGFHWVDTSNTTSSLHLAFRNVRYEQSRSNNWGWYIDYHATVLLKGITFDNCGVSGNGHANGIYLRHTSNVTLINQRFDLSAGKTALNIDNTNHNVVNVNMNNENNVGAETVTSASYVRILGTDKPGGSQPGLTVGGTICLEGKTIDGTNVGCLETSDPTAPRTWTMPDASGPVPTTTASNSWSGAQTFLAGIGGGVPRNIGTWPAFRGVPADATDSHGADGSAFVGSVFVPANMSINGIQYLVGSVGGTNKVIASLHDAAGALVANSATTGVTVGAANTLQQIPFTSPCAAVGPGWYYLALTFNGSAATFRSVPALGNAGSGIVGNRVTQTFGTPAAFPPPTTFTADRVPVASLY